MQVWETMPTVLEHSVGQDDGVANSSTSFSTSFGPDPNSLDHSAAFSKAADQPDDSHEGYSPSPNQSCTSNNTTNVCKVCIYFRSNFTSSIFYLYGALFIFVL